MELLTGGDHRFKNEFCRPFSIDFAPRVSRCEWCGAPATSQITAIGGIHHNEGGYFCDTCGEKFRELLAEPATVLLHNSSRIHT